MQQTNGNVFAPWMKDIPKLSETWLGARKACYWRVPASTAPHASGDDSQVSRSISHVSSNCKIIRMKSNRLPGRTEETSLDSFSQRAAETKRFTFMRLSPRTC